jgi:hypothetical protein
MKIELVQEISDFIFDSGVLKAYEQVESVGQ